MAGDKTKNAKHDPLEAAKVTDDRLKADAEKLESTVPSAPPSVKKELRTDGPTLEAFVLDGGNPDEYPPKGFTETPSPGLTLFKANGQMIDGILDDERARRASALKPTEKVVYVLLEAGRAYVGNGQHASFPKGHVFELAGYGELGIKRLYDSGLKLEKKTIVEAAKG